MFIYQGFVNYGVNNVYCVKSVRILSYSGSYFPAFRLNTEKYSVSLCIQSKCGKMRTRIIPNTDTFYAVVIFWIHRKCKRESLDLCIQLIQVSIFKLLRETSNGRLLRGWLNYVDAFFLESLKQKNFFLNWFQFTLLPNTPWLNLWSMSNCLSKSWIDTRTVCKYSLKNSFAYEKRVID